MWPHSNKLLDSLLPKKLEIGTPRKRLDLPTHAAGTVETPQRVRKPLFETDPNTLTYARNERPQTLTDVLINRVRDRDTSIDSARLRGRIDMLLTGNNETIMQWGEVNLVPLRNAADIQSRIAARMSQIDPSAILTQAHDAMVKKSIFGFGKKPEHYERLLPDVKKQLMGLLQDTDREYRSFVPEVSDLNLDTASLSVVVGEYQDAITLNIANSRLKTLMMAQQTGVMLLSMLENTMQQCIQYGEQIDSFISVTIPQWKVSIQS